MLVVEDSPAVRRRLVERLREAKIDVVGEAASAAVAAALAMALLPEGVVLDVKLSDGSGLELLPWLRETLPAAVVVVVTNEPIPRIRREALRRGADAFLDKATEFERIADALRSARAR